MAEQLPDSCRRLLAEHFTDAGDRLNELPQEEADALGLGITSLLFGGHRRDAVQLGLAGAIRGLPAAMSPVGLAGAGVGASSCRTESEADARLTPPYYPSSFPFCCCRRRLSSRFPRLEDFAGARP